MKKAVTILIVSFFSLAFFATGYSSEYEYRGGYERYERYDDDRYEYRDGHERYDNDRYEDRGGHERSEYRNGRSGRYDNDRYNHRRYSYDD